jgi:hypothetical protein
MSATFTMDVEYTDTYGGDANYCWVRRAELTLPTGISHRAIVRRAKAAMGLSGVRGRMADYGDSFDFRPYRSCTVMFITTRY